MLNYRNKEMRTAVVVAIAAKINNKNVIYGGAFLRKWLKTAKSGQLSLQKAPSQMFDLVLNTPVQTDALVNMWKENCGSLQSTRCNEVYEIE